MTTPVKPESVPRVPTYDEWQAAQYAPHRLGQDPTKPMPLGRVPTFDEFEQAQRSASPKSLTFPAMPKFAADATARLNPNTGPADRSVLEQLELGEHARHVAGGLDVLARDTPGLDLLTRAELKAAAAVTRQAVAPAVEHPLLTAALANPVGAVIGTGMAVHTIAQYGWQKAHELGMSDEDRAKAEADPNRVSGEAAAVQAVMLGLGSLAGVHSITKAGDVGAGMMEAGAAGLKDLRPTDASLSDYVRSDKAFFESQKGAEVLGLTAAHKGLPETASPYPPESPLATAWEEGHASVAGPDTPNAQGFTPTHFAEYRKALEASGLRDLKTDEVLRMSPEELRVYADQAKAAEKGLEGQALDPETLKRFKAAERKANSSFASNEETDAAVKVMQDIEDKMTPHQRLLMYGNRSVEYTTAEDARAMADAAERVSPEGFIHDEQAGHPISSESLLSDVGRLITTGNANLGHNVEHPAALIQLKGTVAELQRRGMTTDQILKAALEERVRRGYANPEQALELAKAKLERLQSGGFFGEKPQTPTSPQLSAGQKQLPATRPAPTPEGAAPSVGAATVPAEPSGTLAPVEGTGPTRTRGLSASTERDAIAAEVADHFRDLPKYSTMDKADQGARAADLLMSNPERAQRVALGEEPPPQGLHPEAVYIAVKHKAIAEGDAPMIDRLVDNRLTTEATTMGQRISLLDDHDPTASDPVKAIQRINDSRTAGAKNPERAIANEVHGATKTITDVSAIDMPMLTKFINSLRC